MPDILDPLAYARRNDHQIARLHFGRWQFTNLDPTPPLRDDVSLHRPLDRVPCRCHSPFHPCPRNRDRWILAPVVGFRDPAPLRRSKFSCEIEPAN